MLFRSYNIMPSEGLLLFPEDIEKDDYLHNPGPDDDERKCVDLLSKRGLTNLGGLALITLGILVLFVGYPVLYAPQNLSYISSRILLNRTEQLYETRRISQTQRLVPAIRTAYQTHYLCSRTCGLVSSIPTPPALL